MAHTALKALIVVGSNQSLTQPFIADHLDPCLAGYPDALTLRIDLSEQLQGEVHIDPLFGDVSIGKVSRNIPRQF